MDLTNTSIQIHCSLDKSSEQYTGEMRSRNDSMLGRIVCIALLSSSLSLAGVRASRAGALGWGLTASSNKGAAKPQVGRWQLVSLLDQLQVCNVLTVVLFGSTLRLLMSAMVFDQNATIGEVYPRHM